MVGSLGLQARTAQALCGGCRRRPATALPRRGREGRRRVASFRDSGSVDPDQYISHVLNSPVPNIASGSAAEAGTELRASDAVVDQAVQEVQEKLSQLNQLNVTLKGQLQTVTSGLETVIQSARTAKQQQHGDSMEAAPNGNGSRPGHGSGDASATLPQPTPGPLQGPSLLQPPPLPPQGQQQQQGQGQQPPPLQPQQPRGDNVVHTSSLSCVVQHPGALCCTRVTGSSNPGAMTCTVSLETTARFSTDDTIRSQLSMEDLQALAAQALVGAAMEYSKGRAQESQARVHPTHRLQQHAELVNILSHGTVVAAERNRPSQFGHESYILKLEDPRTKRRMRAVFKPRVPGDAEGWHRAPIEWVAYELNLLLGMDYVPPVAYRKGGVDIDLGGEEGVVSHDEGAMMYWVENASQLKHYSFECWGMNKDVLLSDTRILDVLLHNSDRHHGHFLLGRHWCDGRWSGREWGGEMRPCLIDHAAGFRRDAHVTMQHENAFQTGPVRCVSAATYLRLRFLDASIISNKFSEFLSEGEMRDLLHRRNYVLRYLDRLVEEQGYAATVVE